MPQMSWDQPVDLPGTGMTTYLWIIVVVVIAAVVLLIIIVVGCVVACRFGGQCGGRRHGYRRVGCCRGHGCCHGGGGGCCGGGGGGCCGCCHPYHHQPYRRRQRIVYSDDGSHFAPGPSIGSIDGHARTPVVERIVVVDGDRHGGSGLHSPSRRLVHRNHYMSGYDDDHAMTHSHSHGRVLPVYVNYIGSQRPPEDQSSMFSGSQYTGGPYGGHSASIELP